ncbi:acyl-CoA dehydrogenase family protein [Mesoterricola silvestris]|uniref:Short/branched chain specific acyl-CoA dehydrogenase, mitochondrial n=1 Tax=Mesoterricola silvestris TaxID=2927979 RepID=A0AA48K7K9_9BACT|nr:acyl-CoA dehydrogenase family protein [Mesoterricola silvestris]BDU71241.1 acyl-CoA dehydrogenase [Mesoterricola silvestris]
MSMPLTQLGEEELAFQELVADFARNEIQPLREAMDEAQEMRPDLVKKLFGLDIMGIEVPEAYGGAGSTFFNAILVIEELSKVDASVGVLVDVQNTLVDNCFNRWGSEEQKRKYLPRLCKDTVGAYALSEAGSGSDAFALSTRATPNAGGYLLNGSKLFITSAQEAGIFVVFATVDPAAGYRGITAFIVERGMPGFTVSRKENKLGIRASSTCELSLADVQVGPGQVLGEVGKGYKVAIETLNEGRIGIAAQMLGLAEGALAHALAYTKERRQFGKAIFDFQAVQMRLAECASRVEAARLMTYNAARMKDAGLPFIREAAMAKYFTSQVAEWVASECLELFGGYGFTKDYPAEKYFRDSKIGKIYEGTTFMQLQTIAKLL